MSLELFCLNRKEQIFIQKYLLNLLFQMNRKGPEEVGGINKIKFRKIKKLRTSYSQSNLSSSQLSQTKFVFPSKPQQPTALKPESNQQLLPLNDFSGLTLSQTQQQLSKTLVQSQYQHHDDKECMCQNCTCGRHLCNFTVKKPDIWQHVNTSYNREFGAKKADKSLILITKEIPTFKSQNLELQSKYARDFRSRNFSAMKEQSLKYSDHLKLEGPYHKISRYSEEFPPHKAINQYVKPTNRCKIGDFPLNPRTTYSKEFIPKKVNRAQSLKHLEQMKTGNKMWMGQTVYQMKFQNPNPEDYPRINPLLSKSQKFLKSPEFVNRFTTSYKKEFSKKESTLCPVKKEISSNINFSKLRSLLNERGDQRGLNPHFKAIATSKLIC